MGFSASFVRFCQNSSPCNWFGLAFLILNICDLVLVERIWAQSVQIIFFGYVCKWNSDPELFQTWLRWFFLKNFKKGVMLFYRWKNSWTIKIFAFQLKIVVRIRCTSLYVLPCLCFEVRQMSTQRVHTRAWFCDVWKC